MTATAAFYPCHKVCEEVSGLLMRQRLDRTPNISEWESSYSRQRSQSASEVHVEQCMR